MPKLNLIVPKINFEDKESGIKLEEFLQDLLRQEEESKTHIGSFTCPVATGIHSVSTVPFKPRFVEFNIIIASNTILSQGTGRMNYKGDMHACWWAEDAGANICQGYATNYCIAVRIGDETNKVFAVFTSMNSNGFSINFSAVDSNYAILFHAIK